MGNTEKKVSKKRDKKMMSLENKGTKKNIQLRRELFTIKKRKANNSSIEKFFDKHGNKVSMHKTVKEVDGGTVTKEKITFFTRDHSTSHQSGNVQDIGEINNFLMIESELGK